MWSAGGKGNANPIAFGAIPPIRFIVINQRLVDSAG